MGKTLYNRSIRDKKEWFLMATVTKDTIIMDVLRIDEGTAPFF